MQIWRFFLLMPECTHIKCSSYVPFKHREFMSSCSWPKDTSPINFVQPLTFSICKSSCKKSREQIRENITNLDCQHSPRAVERANEHTIFHSSHSSLNFPALEQSHQVCSLCPQSPSRCSRHSDQVWTNTDWTWPNLN